jgi:hypothetical protein
VHWLTCSAKAACLVTKRLRKFLLLQWNSFDPFGVGATRPVAGFSAFVLATGS